MNTVSLGCWSLALGCLVASVTLAKHYPRIIQTLRYAAAAFAAIGIALLFAPNVSTGSISIGGSNSGNACTGGATCTQGPPHDPSRFYYHDQDVGTGTVSTIAPDGKTIMFSSVVLIGDFTATDSFQFGLYVLSHCRGQGYEETRNGGIKSTTIDPPIICRVEHGP